MDHRRISRLMGHLWAPVAAVTSQWRGKPNAQIAVAIGSASIVPDSPRVIVQIYKRNLSHSLIHGSGAFALNFLRPDQLDLIPAFGLVSGRDHDKLSTLEYDLKSSGSPVLRDCWGYLDCLVVNAMDAGDMTCFLGEVIEGDTVTEGEPLWWRDAARRLPPEVMEAWTQKIAGEMEHSMSHMGNIDYTPWQPGGRPH